MGLRSLAGLAFLVLLSADASAQNRRVLWDTHHGVYFPYTLTGKFTQMVAALQTVGIDVVESSAGVLNVNLDDYDAVVVSVLNASVTAYDAAEAARIATYASGGRGVLLIGDNAAVWPQLVNPVAAQFDMALGTAHISPNNYTVTDLAAGEEMFEGITSVYGVAGGVIGTGTDALPVGKVSAQTAIARWSLGRVVALGDGNTFEDSYIHNADNLEFSKRLFEFLTQGCAQSLGPGSPGSGGVVPSLGIGGASCEGAFSLHVSKAVGGGTMLLLAGTAAAVLPVTGGALYVDPFTPPFVAIALPLGGQPGAAGAGSLVLAQDLTPYLPVSLVLQTAVFDGGAAGGIALSNGLRIDMAP